MVIMAKQEQVLQLEPANELHFKGPFTDVVISYLKLINPIDQRVCFKVKTTAPKKYCVRPNSGFLEPKQVVNVAVMLQPFDYNPNEKNKHKFMVQTMIMPDGDVNIENLWRDAQPDSLMDSKLRCVFDVAPEESVQNNNFEPVVAQFEDRTVNKVVTDSAVKSSPKTTNLELELKKATDECKRLRDDIMQMKQENSQLKAEGLRLRSARSTTSDANPQLGRAKPMHELAHEQPQSPMLYLAVMLTIGLLGIFIGKFVV